MREPDGWTVDHLRGKPEESAALFRAVGALALACGAGGVLRVYLVVNHVRVRTADELDETIQGGVREAYAVAAGAHLGRRALPPRVTRARSARRRAGRTRRPDRGS